MGIVWYEQDREAVLAARGRGERPDRATTMAAGRTGRAACGVRGAGGAGGGRKHAGARRGGGCAAAADASAVTVCGSGFFAWSGGGVVPRAGDPTAVGLGAGADPAGPYPAAAASGRAAS